MAPFPAWLCGPIFDRGVAARSASSRVLRDAASSVSTSVGGVSVLSLKAAGSWKLTRPWTLAEYAATAVSVVGSLVLASSPAQLGGAIPSLHAVPASA